MPHNQPAVVVIGSINIDLVVRAPSIPAPGETILGDELRTLPGGKGANQAVAAARLGARCHFVGAVGDDTHGRRMIDELNSAGVNTEHVRRHTDAATGAALITIDSEGNNAITVAAGANRLVAPEDVDRAENVIRGADVCLLQLEIPLETNLRAIHLCREFGTTTVLDAAPAVPDPPDELLAVDVLTANLGEAEVLTGRPSSAESDRARVLIARLADRNCKQIVLKLGHRGAIARAKPDVRDFEPFRVDVVDTTAAGDAFNAALGVAIASHCDLFTAVRRANAAGALACTTLGAMPAMPTREALEALLARGNSSS